MIPKSIITLFKNQQPVCHYKPFVSTSTKTICFIPGFRSDAFTSKKSVAIYKYCVDRQVNFLSWNHNEKGTVQDWYKQGLEVIDHYTDKDHKMILVGASMGLWLSLLIGSQRDHVTGIVGIGGGVDFTERWLLNEVPLEKRNDLDYVYKRPSAYDPKGYYEIPVSFLIGSRPALIKNKLPLNIKCPVRLVHGSDDQDVAIEKSKELCRDLQNSNIDVSLDEIKGGDHRLSSHDHIALIINKINSLL